MRTGQTCVSAELRSAEKQKATRESLSLQSIYNEPTLTATAYNGSSTYHYLLLFSISDYRFFFSASLLMENLFFLLHLSNSSVPYSVPPAGYWLLVSALLQEHVLNLFFPVFLRASLCSMLFSFPVFSPCCPLSSSFFPTHTCIPPFPFHSSCVFFFSSSLSSALLLLMILSSPPLCFPPLSSLLPSHCLVFFSTNSY